MYIPWSLFFLGVQLYSCVTTRFRPKKMARLKLACNNGKKTSVKLVHRPCFQKQCLQKCTFSYENWRFFFNFAFMAWIAPSWQWWDFLCPEVQPRDCDWAKSWHLFHDVTKSSLFFSMMPWCKPAREHANAKCRQAVDGMPIADCDFYSCLAGSCITGISIVKLPAELDREHSCTGETGEANSSTSSILAPSKSLFLKPSSNDQEAVEDPDRHDSFSKFETRNCSVDILSKRSLKTWWTFECANSCKNIDGAEGASSCGTTTAGCGGNGDCKAAGIGDGCDGTDGCTVWGTGGGGGGHCRTESVRPIGVRDGCSGTEGSEGLDILLSLTLTVWITAGQKSSMCFLLKCVSALVTLRSFQPLRSMQRAQ